jgi:Cyclin
MDDEVGVGLLQVDEGCLELDGDSSDINEDDGELDDDDSFDVDEEDGDTDDGDFQEGEEWVAEVHSASTANLHDIHRPRSCCKDAGVSDDEFIAGLAAILSELCVANEPNAVKADAVQSCVRLFYAAVSPQHPLDASSYVARIVDNIPCRPTLITALVFIDRIFNAHSALALCTANFHRLVITAVTIASKVLEDEPFGQEFYRQVGGVESIAELNALEIRFLTLLNWNVHVSKFTYDEYKAAVHTRFSRVGR